MVEFKDTNRDGNRLDTVEVMEEPVVSFSADNMRGMDGRIELCDKNNSQRGGLRGKTKFFVLRRLSG